MVTALRELPSDCYDPPTSYNPTRQPWIRAISTS
jgi:hypothetical protein